MTFILFFNSSLIKGKTPKIKSTPELSQKNAQHLKDFCNIKIISFV
jgi:hypothetical protein